MVGEIKTYPDRAGYTDARELATARAQAGVYVHGLDFVLEELGLTGAFTCCAARAFSCLHDLGSTVRPFGPARILRYQAERAKRGFELLRAGGRNAASGRPAGNGSTPSLAADINYCEAVRDLLRPRRYMSRERLSRPGDGAVLGDDVARFLGNRRLQRALELMAGAEPAERSRSETSHGGSRTSRTCGGSHDGRRSRPTTAGLRSGKPLPRGETLRVKRLPDEQILILAFVKMGGESSPWGIAYGRPGRSPRS